MAYKGEAYIVDCSRGGLTGEANIDRVPDYMMITGSKNINLNKNGRESRGGTDHHGTAAYTNTPNVRGIYNYVLYDGTSFIMGACATGAVYKSASTTAIVTGMSTSTYYDWETMGNKLYFVDGKTTPQVWDGAAATSSDISTPPSDWGTTNPSWLFKHGRGNSERMIYGGCSSNPSNVYISANGDPEDPGDTNGVVIGIDTGDGYGITGGVEFGDKALLFSKRKNYILDDVDVDTTYWGYAETQWTGGASHPRLIERIPNDVICMTDDGEVYSITAAESYGDYRAGSLTRPAFMDEWIKENLDLSKISQFHMKYDPRIRALRIFAVRSGQTTVDTCLCYFIDRPAAEAWAVHDSTAAAGGSGMYASVSCLGRKTAGDYRIYTGDYAGMTWELESSNLSDNSTAYTSKVSFPYMHMGDPRGDKSYKRGWVVAYAESSSAATYNISVDTYVDNNQVGTTQTVSLLGTTVGDDLLLPFDINHPGNRIRFDIYNATVNQKFNLSSIYIDHKSLGRKPE